MIRLKILTIIGARPQFIKASAISAAIVRYNSCHKSMIDEIIVHTGQHFDDNMSSSFFSELNIPIPKINLGVSGMTHGAMTGRMLEKVEAVLLEELPDFVLVYGDTNSTVAGALAASKLHIPVVHVEAGLRSYNTHMPEEINRVITDKLSSFLFCPTESSVNNLYSEGIHAGVHNVGDVMYDVAIRYKQHAIDRISLDKWGLNEKEYGVFTMHREENVEYSENISSIFDALESISNELPILFPVHPRMRKIIDKINKDKLKNLILVEPLSYIEMLRVLLSAKIVMTDSGGLQKEAYFHRVPCLTLREETEWVETLEHGWNKLVGVNKREILDAYTASSSLGVLHAVHSNFYGDGRASDKIIEIMLR